MSKFKKAYDFATMAHRGQERKYTGQPYIMHLEETAQILWEITDGKATHDMYEAALLHDTVEDTEVTLEDIGKNFGGNVMNLVGELTINGEEMEKEGKKFYLARRLNEMSDSALSIKLCDRFSNVSGLVNEAIPNKFASRYINETIYILDHLEKDRMERNSEVIGKLTKIIVYLKIDRDL